MINLSDRIPAHYSQRARTELSAAWDHLLNAAQEAARQVGDTSRTRGSVARERAALARLALRGELPNSRWRWAGAGLAAGVVIGVVAAAAVSRRPHPADPGDPSAPQQPDQAPTSVLDKARTAADKARQTITRREPAAETPTPPTAATDNDT